MVANRLVTLDWVLDSVTRFLRRHAALIVVAIMAMFLWDQGSRREPVDQTGQIHVVTGTVAEFHTYRETVREAKKTRDAIRHAVTTTGHPANVWFVISRVPDGYIPVGAQVRMEVSGDPAEDVEAAVRYPDVRQQVRVVGLTVNGSTVYSGEGDRERAKDAVWGWRIASLVCWAVVIGRIALLAWRHRVRLREMSARLRAVDTASGEAVPDAPQRSFGAAREPHDRPE